MGKANGRRGVPEYRVRGSDGEREARPILCGAQSFDLSKLFRVIERCKSRDVNPRERQRALSSECYAPESEVARISSTGSSTVQAATLLLMCALAVETERQIPVELTQLFGHCWSDAFEEFAG